METLVRELLMMDESKRPLTETINLLEANRVCLCENTLGFTPMYMQQLTTTWLTCLEFAISECRGFLDVQYRMRLLFDRYPDVVCIQAMADITSKLYTHELEVPQSRCCGVM